MRAVSRWVGIVAVTAASGFGAAAQAQDGATLYTTKTCVACHGAGGAAPIAPTYPKLAGQNKAYLINQIKDIDDPHAARYMAEQVRRRIQVMIDQRVIERRSRRS